MGTTTMGVKLDDATRERIKSAATRIDRTPHWLIKQAIFSYLEQLENSDTLPELPALLSGAANESDEAPTPAEEPHQPFLDFAEQILPQSVSRAAITAAYRRPETEAVSMLLEQARLPQPVAEQAHKLAYQLADKLRNQKNASGRAGMVQGLLQEFSLSSQEGVALMCLAEALLRIPDKATRDALIRDKISNGNWQSHIGRSPSLFVNAATWGLLFTGKLVSTHNEASLSRSLNRIIGKSGEPLIRKGVDMAMRLMGEQFVTGETIAEALANGRQRITIEIDPRFLQRDPPLINDTLFNTAHCHVDPGSNDYLRRIASFASQLHKNACQLAILQIEVIRPFDTNFICSQLA